MHAAVLGGAALACCARPTWMTPGLTVTPARALLGAGLGAGLAMGCATAPVTARPTTPTVTAASLATRMNRSLPAPLRAAPFGRRGGPDTHNLIDGTTIHAGYRRLAG